MNAPYDLHPDIVSELARIEMEGSGEEDLESALSQTLSGIDDSPSYRIDMLIKWALNEEARASILWEELQILTAKMKGANSRVDFVRNLLAAEMQAQGIKKYQGVRCATLRDGKQKIEIEPGLKPEERWPVRALADVCELVEHYKISKEKLADYIAANPDEVLPGVNIREPKQFVSLR